MLVAVSVVAIAAVFGFALPESQAASPDLAPSSALPYAHPAFTVTDAERVFGAEGIRLIAKSHVPGVVTTVGTRHDALEVDVFGDPQVVASNGGGFGDYTVDAAGKAVPFPHDCAPGNRTAERWHGNVRVMVSCAGTGAASGTWLERVDRALARL